MVTTSNSSAAMRLTRRLNLAALTVVLGLTITAAAPGGPCGSGGPGVRTGHAGGHGPDPGDWPPGGVRSALVPPQTSTPAQPPMAFFPGFAPGALGYVNGSFGWNVNTSVLPVDHVPPGPGFLSMLRVVYPKGSVNLTAVAQYHTPLGGAQAAMPFTAGQHIDYLSYYVRFEPGFQFKLGGKLPGLYGGDTEVASGGHDPNGTNGFSVRLMFRTGGAGEAYAYLDQPGNEPPYGDEIGRGNWYWQTGVWTLVQLEAVPNDVGKTDGTVGVWINRKQAVAATGLKFRTTAKLDNDGMFFSTFFGGHTKDWASPRTQYADFADFSYADVPLGAPLPAVGRPGWAGPVAVPSARAAAAGPTRR